MTPLDRLAEFYAKVDFAPQWREVADALIAVARAAHVKHARGHHDPCHYMRDVRGFCNCGTDALGEALAAANTAIVKALGEGT